jgi:hypothetical protein
VLSVKIKGMQTLCSLAEPSLTILTLMHVVPYFSNIVIESHAGTAVAAATV